MIKFDDIGLLGFFEAEAVPDRDEPSILRYAVQTRTGMDLVFTIDSPLGCTHLRMSRNGVVIVDVGSEGVTEINVVGKGDDEVLECEVSTSSATGKMTISWKSTPHFRSHLLDRGER